MAYCIVDLETASRADLKLVGASCYFEDISTHILCVGYQIGLSGNVCQWRPSDGKIPADLAAAVADPSVYFVAHNAIFERSGWNTLLVPIHEWPPLPAERWLDTMATCFYRALPGKLKTAANVLELPTQKGEVPLKYFRPARDGSFLEPGPELLAYNKDDVRAEADLLKRIGLPEKNELEVWRLDQTINSRGVAVDLSYVAACQEVVEQASEPLQEEFAWLTGGLAVGQVAKVLEWAKSQGSDLPDLKAETLKEILGKGIDDIEEDDLEDLDTGTMVPYSVEIIKPNVRRALEIRRILGSASIKKLQRIPYVVGVEGRARGLLQYHGATTGRWTGRLLQPQNFPRGTVKIEGEAPEPQVLVDAIMSRDADLVDTLFGNPIAAVASGLRHCLVAGPGMSLVVGDFSTIEARIVLALAGQWGRVAALAKGENLYIPVAEKIYGRTISKRTDLQEYTIGKNTVLGCGFQMGWQKFQDRYAKDKPEEFCRGVVDIYRKEFAPEVPKLWEGLGNAAFRCAATGRPHDHAGILYERKDRWLTARLPSGRRLWYFNPQLKKKAMPWDKTDIREIWCYQTMKSGQWRTVDAYGGSLCLGASAEVLTHRGWLAIVDVQLTDWLWDGEEWVEHSGLVFQGYKETISFGGIQMTPDHKVYGEGGFWQRATDCNYDRAVGICEALGRQTQRNAGDRSLPWFEQMAREHMAGSLRLHPDEDSSEARLLLRGREFLWVQHQRFVKACGDETSNPRTNTAPNVASLAQYARSLPQPKIASLEQLRRARDYGMPALARLSEFLGGYVPELQERIRNRQERQRWSVFARELQVGDVWRTSTQSPHNNLAGYTERSDDVVRSKPALWNRKNNVVLAGQERMASGEAIPVYDIMNAGPRKRFTVRGADGREIIVSNCANVVQATARDLLVAAMFKCEEENLPVVLTVHDEAVCEVPAGQADHKMLEQIMCDIPSWARNIGIPVAAECWQGDRYRK